MTANTIWNRREMIGHPFLGSEFNGSSLRFFSRLAWCWQWDVCILSLLRWPMSSRCPFSPGLYSWRGCEFCHRTFLRLMRWSCDFCPSVYLWHGSHSLTYICWIRPMSLRGNQLVHMHDSFSCVLELSLQEVSSPERLVYAFLLSFVFLFLLVAFYLVLVTRC